mgnify:CR=1 FL=1
MKSSLVKLGEFATFLKDLESSYRLSSVEATEARGIYAFDRILWLYAGRFSKDSEELLRLYAECWIRYRMKSGDLDMTAFEDAISCIDWLIAEQYSLREAPVPLMCEFTAFVFQRGPRSLRTRVNCHSRGRVFFEGVVRAVGDAFGVGVSVRCTQYGASFCELELSCSEAARLSKSS